MPEITSTDFAGVPILQHDSFRVDDINNSEVDDDDYQSEAMLQKHTEQPRSMKRLRISLRPEDTSLEIAAYPHSFSTK